MRGLGRDALCASTPAARQRGPTWVHLDTVLMVGQAGRQPYVAGGSAAHVGQRVPPVRAQGKNHWSHPV